MEIAFIKGRNIDGCETVVFPISRLDCILRTDRDRPDVFKVIGEDTFYQCDCGRFQDAIEVIKC